MAVPDSRLTKDLYLDISNLKSLTYTDPKVKFKLEKTPFDDDDEEQGTATATTSKDIVITGRIFPDSEIYKEGSYQIEIKLTPTYPFDPPEVRFLTKIYHPNVDKDGKFCHELLKKTAKWSTKTSLVDVVRAVTEHVDKPDIDYSLSVELGREYIDNRPEFNRKALQFVKDYALPRS